MVNAQGVVLVGEAAKSWVYLQWVAYVTNSIIMIVMFGGIAFAAYKFWQKVKEDL